MQYKYHDTEIESGILEFEEGNLNVKFYTSILIDEDGNKRSLNKKFTQMDSKYGDDTGVWSSRRYGRKVAAVYNYLFGVSDVDTDNHKYGWWSTEDIDIHCMCGKGLNSSGLGVEVCENCNQLWSVKVRIKPLEKK